MLIQNNLVSLHQEKYKKKKVKAMKQIYLMAVALLCCLTTRAQDKLSAELYADFVSSYNWRGMELSKASVQPALLLGYRGLELEFWGSYELVGSANYHELDIALYYTLGRFKFKVQDIWSNVGADPQSRYFKYEAHSTNHMFEACVGYDFGPVCMEWNTVFAGNDGLNNSGKRAYSSYFLAEAPFRLAGFDWKGSLGVSPFASTMYKTSGFAVINLGLKVSRDIKVTDTFHIPVFADIVANPRLQNAYIIFGFTLKPFS